MSKPAFKTFIVILIVTAIASTSGQQDGGSTRLVTQGPGAVRLGSENRGSGADGGNSGAKQGSGGTGVSQSSGSSGSSGTGGGGLIDGIISIPATLLSVILSPIRALLSFTLGNIGNLVGTILNLVFNLLRTILTPIGYIVGLPLDVIADTLSGIGSAVGHLIHGIFSLLFSNLGGRNSETGSTLAIAGPAASTRVRRDLVMEAIMGRSL